MLRLLWLVPVAVGAGLLLAAPTLPVFSRPTAAPQPAKAAPTPEPTPEREIPLSDGFDYPVGEKGFVTPEKDGDGWYNARGFRSQRHLGEDWNAESGGNTDCGEPVFAASKGRVVLSEDLRGGWGQVVLVRHRLPDGQLVETLYAHLDKRFVQTGDEVRRGQQIAAIGDAEPPCGDNRPYYAHLHFELRSPNCPHWGQSGEGYGLDATGWLDPSRFIDENRFF